jgi:hypothetical protein
MKPTDITEVPDDRLDDIRDLVDGIKSHDKKIEDLELQLEAVKSERHRMATEFLPDLMLGAGIQSIRLADGTFVYVDKFYNAKIPDERKPAAFNWLDTNGFGGLIKTEITTKHTRGDRRNALRALELLKKHGFVPLQKDEVHWQTLRAWVKEQIEGGAPPPKDLFGTYIGNIAKFKS